MDTYKKSAKEEIAKREEGGNFDQIMEMQEFNIPMVNASFIGYEIDMLFEYNDGEGAASNVWCQGKVVSIVKENTNVVGIK